MMMPVADCSTKAAPTCSRLRAALARPEISLGKYSARIAKLRTVAAPVAAMTVQRTSDGIEQAQDQGGLSRHGRDNRHCQRQFRLDADATKATCHRAKKQRCNADGDRHGTQVLDNRRTLQSFDVAEPRCRPKTLQRPGRPDAHSRKRSDAPEAAISISGP